MDQQRLPRPDPQGAQVGGEALAGARGVRVGNSVGFGHPLQSTGVEPGEQSARWRTAKRVSGRFAPSARC